MHLTKLHLHNLDVHCLLFIHNKNVRLKLSACRERTKARLKKRKGTQTTTGLSGHCAFYILFMEIRKFSHGQRKAWTHRQRRVHFQRLGPICKPSVTYNDMSSVSHFPGSLVSSQSNVNENCGPGRPLARHGPLGALRKHEQESRNHSAARPETEGPQGASRSLLERHGIL